MTLVLDRAHRHDGPALGQLLGREILGIELGKQASIAASAHGSDDVALLDAVEAVEHVERPGAELAEFAVTDDVDAGLLLPPDHLANALLQERVESRSVDGQAVLHRLDVLDELRWANEAAHMRRENAVGACWHGTFTPASPSIETQYLDRAASREGRARPPGVSLSRAVAADAQSLSMSIFE